MIKPIPENLTEREQDCLPLILLGDTSKEIAKKLGISHRTVEGYLESLRKKFKARNKNELIAKLAKKIYCP